MKCFACAINVTPAIPMSKATARNIPNVEAGVMFAPARRKEAFQEKVTAGQWRWGGAYWMCVVHFNGYKIQHYNHVISDLQPGGPVGAVAISRDATR